MSLAEIVRRWQLTRMHSHELEALGFEEVEAIARDIGVSDELLKSLAARGPGAGVELSKLMQALSLDATEVARKDAALMRDMSIACSGCQEVGYCRRDLEEGTASSNFTQYCPNGDTLRELQGKGA